MACRMRATGVVKSAFSLTCGPGVVEGQALEARLGIERVTAAHASRAELPRDRGASDACSPRSSTRVEPRRATRVEAGISKVPELLRSSDLRLRLRISRAFMGGASRGNGAVGSFPGRFCGRIHQNVTKKPWSRRTHISVSQRFCYGPQRLCYVSGPRMQQIFLGHFLSRRAWRRPRRRERLARKLESLVVLLLEARDPQPARALGNP
jgi:hypothetical protein